MSDFHVAVSALAEFIDNSLTAAHEAKKPQIEVMVMREPSGKPYIGACVNNDSVRESVCDVGKCHIVLTHVVPCLSGSRTCARLCGALVLVFSGGGLWQGHGQGWDC